MPKTWTDQANVAEPCIAFLDPVSVGAINPVNVGRSARRPGIPVVRTEAPFPHPSLEKARLACRALRHRAHGSRSVRACQATGRAEQAHKHSDLCPPRHVPIVCCAIRVVVAEAEREVRRRAVLRQPIPLRGGETVVPLWSSGGARLAYLCDQRPGALCTVDTQGRRQRVIALGVRNDSNDFGGVAPPRRRFLAATA